MSRLSAGMSRRSTRMETSRRLALIRHTDAVSTPDALAPASATTGRCPVCQAPLVSERGAAAWCEQCGWRLGVYEPSPGTSWLRRRAGALSHRIAYRMTMGQFRALAGGALPVVGASASQVGPLAKPRPWGPARLVVVAFALTFYALIIGLGYLGVRLILLQFPSPTIVLGALALLIAGYLLPRFSCLPAGVEVLRREDAPTLYAFVDRVAAAARTPRPKVIAVEPWFNAMTMATGPRRQRALVIGMALWGALEPPQRVAVIAHELGHFANGDSLRGWFTQPAMTTLGRLADLFDARPVVRFFRGVGGDVDAEWSRWRGAAGTGGTHAKNLLEPLVTAAMRVIGALLYLVHFGVLAVVLRDTQRREYLADQTASRLAGSEATTQVLDLLVSDVDTVIASLARAQQTNAAWRQAAERTLRSDRAVRSRLRQLSARRDASLRRHHPPSGLRAWLIDIAPPQGATLVLGEVESDRIDAELVRQYQRTRRDLAQSRV